jgi:hypothetical protein
MRALRVLAALAPALAWVACGASEEPSVYRAPAQARAAWLLEPPVVAVGEVATLDLAVVAAPGTALRPFELPSRVDGFFVLDRESPERVEQPERWIHHTRLRVRAIEVGRFEVPGGSVEVESREGGTQVLHYEPLPVEVVSVLGQASRQSPYGIRLLAGGRAGGAGTLGAFAAGAVLTLASVGMLLLVRRRMARDPQVEPAQADPAQPPWEIARSALERARETLPRDPRRALDEASLALRRYAVRRFGGDANVRTREELSGAKPPFTLTTRWPRFLALLAALDGERFPPPPGAGPQGERAAERASALLADVESFVEDTAPRGPST